MSEKNDPSQSNTGGDIKVGDITNAQGIAIGHHAKATVTEIGNDWTPELEKIFSTLLDKVYALSDGPEKNVAENATKALEAEAKKGDKAEEGTVRKWLHFLAETAPDAWEVAIDTFIHPIKGLSTVFRKVAERAKAERSQSASTL